MVDHLKDAIGERKFPSILKIVKTVLVLGHFNTEFERRFSESGKRVTDGVHLHVSEASIASIQVSVAQKQ